MKLLNALLAWLKGKPRRQIQPNDPDLNPIDTEAIKHEVGLEREAERLGLAGIPSQSATSLCGLEEKLLQMVDGLRQRYVMWGHERLRVLNQDIISHDITPLANRALEADATFERKADALLNERKVSLQALSEIALAQSTEYNQFRQKNGLTRLAQYPSPSGKFLLYSLLALFIFGEGVLNATFFAQGLTGGLIQGFTFAAVLSFINIFLGAILGSRLIPNVHHRNSVRKALGFLSVGLATVLALTMALLIAHARDALTSDLDNAAVVALKTLTSSPFELADINSWILFGLSIVFAVLAILDGYKLDDPYPGYGSQSRRMKIAIENCDEEMSLVRAELEGLKEEAIHQLELDAKDIKARLNFLSEAILSKEATGGRLKLEFSNARACANTLVKTFQNVNQLHRPSNSPVPSYFGKDVELQPLAVPSFDVADDRAKYEVQLTLSDKVANRHQELIANIQASFNSKHDSLKALDDHFPTKT
jgi:hypothetical protein